MQQQRLEKIIKITLAGLFLLCLLDMPYGLYNLVRFAAMVGFALLAYQRYREEAMELTILYGGLALLFQPFIKIALGRTLWNIVDVVLAIGLLASLFIKRK